MERQPFDWEEADIERLIDNQIQESTTLDYKRCKALIQSERQSKNKIIEDLSKDVSSFANAEGGTIIYGVIEENHLPKDIDEGYDPLVIKREWLEDVIDSNVKPKIEGIKIKQILLKNRSPNKVIYAVYIPQTLQGAIQANDYRYYQRRNFKAEPMEDYQVRDVMNRFKYPIVEAEIGYERVHSPTEYQFRLILKLVNKGVITAKAFGMDLFFPNISSPFLTGNESRIITLIAEEYPKYDGYRFRNSGSPATLLFPGQKVSIFGTDTDLRYILKGEDVHESLKLKVYITTFADDMPPKAYEYPFRDFYR